MAEAIAAIGLVASIIQLADFAKRLLERLDEFESQLKDLPGSFQAIRLRLRVVLNSIRHLQTQQECGQIPDDVAQTLNDLVEVCLQEVEFLLEALDKVLPKASASTWERRLLAVKSLGKDKTVDRRIRQLEGHLNALTLHQTTIILDVIQAKVLVPADVFPPTESSIVPVSLTVPLIEQSAPAVENPNPPEPSDDIPDLKFQDTGMATWQGRLLSKPSLFNEIANETGSLEAYQNFKDLQVGRQPTVETTFRRRKVYTCRHARVFESPRMACRGPALFSRVSNPHKSSCQFYSKNASTREVGLRVSFISHQLQKVVDTAFSLKFGAGGLCINPLLTLRGFVRRESPAFDLIQTHVESLSGNADECISVFQHVQHRLKQLYDTGEASPTDVLEDGRTIALVVYRHCMWFFGRVGKVAMIDFLKSLIDLGVPINETSVHRGMTVSDMIAEDFCLHDGSDLEFKAFRALLDYGAEFMEWNHSVENEAFTDAPTYRSIDGPSRVNTLRSIPEFAEARNCNNLSLAILARSEAEVKRFLRLDPQSINGRNAEGNCPLHLAATWPWAVQTLIQMGADIEVLDQCRMTPLAYSLRGGNIETLQMFLTAGSLFTSGRYPDNVFEDACQWASLEVFQALVDELVRRRQELLSLSKCVLPAQIVLGILDDLTIIPEGDQVRRLVLELEAVGTVVDIHKYAGKLSSVYHINGLNVVRAEYLFNSGFRDIHILDDKGLSPLGAWGLPTMAWMNPRASFLSWLVSKGARSQEHLIYRPGNSKTVCSGRSALYFVAYGFANIILDMGDHDEDIANLCLLLSTRFESTDVCDCACSTGGCTPYTVLLNRILHETPWFAAQGESQMLRVAHACISDTRMDNSRMVREATRMFLFHKLKLTHTCCPHGRGFFWTAPPMTSEDVREIHDEEDELLMELEHLCEKAESEWDAVPERFDHFMRRFVRKNINVRKRAQPFDEDYIRSVKALGVRIKEDRDEDDLGPGSHYSPEHYADELSTDGELDDELDGELDDKQRESTEVETVIVHNDSVNDFAG